jgi:hypothetical protein
MKPITKLYICHSLPAHYVAEIDGQMVIINGYAVTSDTRPFKGHVKQLEVVTPVSLHMASCCGYPITREAMTFACDHHTDPMYQSYRTMRLANVDSQLPAELVA